MTGVDTNILVAAHRADSPWHARARRVLVDLAEGKLLWAIAWPCIHEFLAVVTHPGIYRPPTPMEVAITAVRSWGESPFLRLIGETPGHLETLSALVKQGHIQGPKVHDARIAAICIDHGVRLLYTADRDFSRFPQLKVQNPLIG